MASELLGYDWERRDLLAPAADAGDDLGAAMVAEMHAIGGPGAAVLLSGFAALASDSDLAAKAAAAVESLAPLPEWTSRIGRARLASVAEMREDVFDDGRTYFIESERDDGTREVVGIYVDNNLGRSAKDIMLAGSIEEVRTTLADVPRGVVAEVSVDDIDPAIAGRRLRAALNQTDRTIDPVIEEDYASLRALAHSRVRSLPGEDLDPEFEPTEPDRRDVLLEEFLASPEGDGIELGGEAADVVETAIDYASDYSDGRALRWSPVVIELFMADWLPRKVIADDAYFAAVPEALAAWVRFAARKRDLPDEAVKLNLAAIEGNEREMLDALANPRGTSPSDELLTALREADVDITDERALQTFIAGWNARSGLG